MRCSLEKIGLINPAQARINIVRIEEEGIVMPALCRHCEVPKCVPACPLNCISKDILTSLVSINRETCIGCNLCSKACEYGGPVGAPRDGSKIKPNTTIKVLCDHCGGDPECVKVCPTGAITYIEQTTETEIIQARGLKELAETIKRTGKYS
jgi:Fe-S-cluster-containing dehydrogenase component